VGLLRNDDDPVPDLSVADVTAEEGVGGARTRLTFVVSLNAAATRPVQVNYATADGSARAGEDYAPVSGTLTFAPGERTKTVSVIVFGDETVEPDETFSLRLSAPVNAELADATGLATILNDDGVAPTIGVEGFTDYEGVAGQRTPFTFQVTLSRPSADPVTVQYTTVDGTATAGRDYEPVAGTLTFLPGDTTETVTVIVLGNGIPEPDRVFQVRLSNPVNADLAHDRADGVIRDDDDPLPQLTIQDVDPPEGIPGELTPLEFVVELSGPAAETVRVDYATADGTATAADNDYRPQSGTIVFAPGEMRKTIRVDAVGDDRVEADEFFFVNLSNLVGPAEMVDDQAVGVIENDDVTVPSVSIDDASTVEGDAGMTEMAFDVWLDGPSDSPVTVEVTTSDGTATSLRTGRDFYKIGSLTLQFDPGETRKQVFVQVIGDENIEGDETFFVNLTSATGAVLSDDQATGTIINDDFAVPEINILSMRALEGTQAGGTRPFEFVVVMDEQSTQPVTVDFATASGTAQEGDDFVGRTGTLTFAPGQTTQTIVIDVIADAADEANEEIFFVNLANPVGAVLRRDQGVGTILDDDDPVPRLVIQRQAAVREGHTGTTAVDLTVLLIGQAGRSISVDYTTASATAASGNDFVRQSGTLTFAPGEYQKTITVEVIGDRDVEPDEEFFVNLSNPIGAVLEQPQATVEVLNDDQVVFREDGHAAALQILRLKEQLEADPEPAVRARILDEINRLTLQLVAQFDIKGPFIVAVFDPVDFVLTDSQNRSTGFTEQTGVLQQVPGSYYSGDGAVELLVIPQVSGQRYNLLLAGVGSGEVRAAVNLVASGYVQSAQFQTTLVGSTLEVALDFTLPDQIPQTNSAIAGQTGGPLQVGGIVAPGNQALAFSAGAARAVQAFRESLDATQFSDVSLADLDQLRELASRAGRRSWQVLEELTDSVQSALLELLLPSDREKPESPDRTEGEAAQLETSLIDRLWSEVGEALQRTKEEASGWQELIEFFRQLVPTEQRTPPARPERSSQNGSTRSEQHRTPSAPSTQSAQATRTSAPTAASPPTAPPAPQRTSS
ncbi:MAG: hypothetical protein GXP27_03090, partial [Planctomycetes bacterium]|nr:hypothetical protein [Planctomycetota bacterium]